MKFTILNQCTKNPTARETFLSVVNNTLEYELDVLKKKDVRFSDLSEGEQNEITAHLLPALDDPYEWLIENDHRELMLQTLAKLLDFNTKDNLENFGIASKKAIRTYYAKSLDELFEELQEERHQDYINSLPSHLQRRYNAEHVNGTDYHR